MRRFENEDGVTNIIAMAVVLPVIAVLFAMVIDLARLPLAESRVREALNVASGSTEASLARDSAGPLIDPYLPAGTNLCQFSVSADGNPCDPNMKNATGRQGFFSKTVADAFAERACELARDQFQRSAKGLFSSSVTGEVQQSFAFRFAVVRLPVNGGSGLVAETPEIVGIASDACSGISYASRSAGSGPTVETVASNLASAFRQQGPGAGAWPVLGATPASWLPSYWLIGVGFYEMKHIVGSVSGGADRLVDYSVRPLQNVAGVQSPDV